MTTDTIAARLRTYVGDLSRVLMYEAADHIEQLEARVKELKADIDSYVQTNGDLATRIAELEKGRDTQKGNAERWQKLAMTYKAELEKPPASDLAELSTHELADECRKRGLLP